ncbi:lysylphosphatidylglycerol synthase transmembrane domain-containing protein [Radicibacter daui]|uniref:lysylphosphatidylglycerol synthase transmembrane domain-containing protein n=1 Tax=Radicibacter daui TaxID=3064829 RepID=UPI004046CCB3
MKIKKYIWPAIGLTVVVVSLWLIYHEFRNLSLDDVVESFEAIPFHRWLLATAATVIAYAALAGYDAVALLHLRRKISWLFITIASFTAYALSHNIGASVISGAVVRYRAYSSRGLSTSEVGVLVALCSFTFILGAVSLGGLVLILEPHLLQRFWADVPMWASMLLGAAMLSLVALYIYGGWRGFKPLRIGKTDLYYPRIEVIVRQLIVAPVELLGAAGIIYFALPADAHLSYLTVLGIFLMSFSVALLSHAPGGLGVLEIVFMTALPELAPADVLAALIVFRILYLLIPFSLSPIFVLIFERTELARQNKAEQARSSSGA